MQTAALLMGLRAKGETADEVAGAAHALRGAMVRVEVAAGDGLVERAARGAAGWARSTSRQRPHSSSPGPACRSPSTATGATHRARARRTCSKRSASTSRSRPRGPPSVLREAGLVFLFAPDLSPRDAARRARAQGARRHDDHEPARTARESGGRPPPGDRGGDGGSRAAGCGGACTAGRGSRARRSRRGGHGRGESVGYDTSLGGARRQRRPTGKSRRMRSVSTATISMGLPAEAGGERAPALNGCSRARAPGSSGARCCSTRRRRSTCPDGAGRWRKRRSGRPSRSRARRRRGPLPRCAPRLREIVAGGRPS